MQSSGAVDFIDPWGNHVQVVDYREIQFTKTPAVLRGMGIDSLEKTAAAREGIRGKGLAGWLQHQHPMRASPDRFGGRAAGVEPRRLITDDARHGGERPLSTGLELCARHPRA